MNLTEAIIENLTTNPKYATDFAALLAYDISPLDVYVAPKVSKTTMLDGIDTVDKFTKSISAYAFISNYTSASYYELKDEYDPTKPEFVAKMEKYSEIVLSSMYCIAAMACLVKKAPVFKFQINGKNCEVKITAALSDKSRFLIDFVDLNNKKRTPAMLFRTHIYECTNEGELCDKLNMGLDLYDAGSSRRDLVRVPSATINFKELNYKVIADSLQQLYIRENLWK